MAQNFYHGATMNGAPSSNLDARVEDCASALAIMLRLCEEFRPEDLIIAALVVAHSADSEALRAGVQVGNAMTHDAVRAALTGSATSTRRPIGFGGTNAK